MKQDGMRLISSNTRRFRFDNNGKKVQVPNSEQNYSSQNMPASSQQYTIIPKSGYNIGHSF
jgi:hypothetical protein